MDTGNHLGVALNPARRNFLEVLQLRNYNFSKGRLAKAMASGTALVAAGVGMSLTGHEAKAIPTTLTFYPSTDFVSMGDVHLNVSTYGKGLKTNAFDSVGLTYGWGPDTSKAFGRTEFGFDYETGPFVGVDVDKRVELNAKTQLFNDDAKGERVVVGTWGVGQRGNLTTGNTILPPDYIYLLGSKAFSFGRIHVGVEQALAKKDVLATLGEPSPTRTSLQLGYDKSFSNGKWVFSADWISGKSAYGVAAPALLYNINDRSDVQVGWIRYNDSTVGPSRNQTYAAFDYFFSVLKKKK